MTPLGVEEVEAISFALDQAERVQFDGVRQGAVEAAAMACSMSAALKNSSSRSPSKS